MTYTEVAKHNADEYLDTIAPSGFPKPPRMPSFGDDFEPPATVTARCATPPGPRKQSRLKSLNEGLQTVFWGLAITALVTIMALGSK